MIELLAGHEVIAFGIDAFVVVDVVLPAVLGLILIGEPGVETYHIKASAAKARQSGSRASRSSSGVVVVMSVSAKTCGLGIPSERQ